jgi:hypothetical protein
VFSKLRSRIDDLPLIAGSMAWDPGSVQSGPVRHGAS